MHSIKAQQVGPHPSMSGRNARLPAVHKDGLVASLPLHLSDLLNGVYDTAEAGALAVRLPACDVELHHLMCLACLKGRERERETVGRSD